MDDIEKSITHLQNRLSELRCMGIDDSFDLEMDILNKMPEFYENYPSIVKRLCRDEKQDNAYLYKMISMLKDVEKNKKTLSGVEFMLGEELAQKFVYPVVNKLDNSNKVIKN